MDIRKNAQEKRIALDEYAQQDSAQYPGWTFLVRDVVEAYGVCPFLSGKEPEATSNRSSWLSSRTDGGEIYRTSISFLTDEHVIQTAKENVNKAVESLKEAVSSTLQAHGFQNHDALLDTITSYKQSRNRNKKLKMVWMSTTEEFMRIRAAVGLDFCAYFDVLTGKKGARIKKLVGDEGNGDSQTPLHPDIASVMSRVSDADRALNAMLDKREVDRMDAEAMLYKLIGCNFNTGQEGRYFKKWYALLPEQKEDRLRSYSEAFVSKMDSVVDRPALGEEMACWLIEALKEKTLKTGDIQWNTKKGYVEGVKRLTYSTDSGFSVEGKVPTESVEVEGAVSLAKVSNRHNGRKDNDGDNGAAELRPAKRRKRGSGAAGPRGSSDARGFAPSVQIRPVDEERLNRLLAIQLLVCDRHEPDLLCDFVLKSYVKHAPPSVKKALRSNIQDRYANMVKVIRQNPMKNSVMPPILN